MGRQDSEALCFEVRISDEIKNWIENLIVPLLVKRYLEQYPKASSVVPASAAIEERQAPTLLDKLLVTKKEAAHALSISPRTLDNMISRREIPIRRIGRRVLVPLRALQRIAQQSIR